MATRTSATHRVLAADIGGTSCRFALFSYERRAEPDARAMLQSLTLVRKVVFPTQQNTSTAMMMRTLASLAGEDGGYCTPLSPAPEYPSFAVLGVPGPAGVADPAASGPQEPEGGVCRCPNIPWPIAQRDVASALGGVPVRLVNDFVVQGFAAALLPGMLDATPVLAGTADARYPVAVIGAGTGLGHCAVLPGSTPRVLGSEAGHCLFPFEGGEEQAYAKALAAHHGTERIVCDYVVSGGGLASLYAFHTGEKLPPREVPARAAAHPATLAWMARFYGRACRQYVLATRALGGVYIAGGLAANLPEVLLHPAFAQALRGNDAMTHMLETVPVWRIRNQDAGLVGAAVFAVLAVCA